MRHRRTLYTIIAQKGCFVKRSLKALLPGPHCCKQVVLGQHTQHRLFRPMRFMPMRPPPNTPVKRARYSRRPQDAHKGLCYGRWIAPILRDAHKTPTRGYATGGGSRPSWVHTPATGEHAGHRRTRRFAPTRYHPLIIIDSTCRGRPTCLPFFAYARARRLCANPSLKSEHIGSPLPHIPGIDLTAFPIWPIIPHELSVRSSY